ncbi:hypothetical protein [Glycomyces arizonensis]|uniref:hypothetical protein n=1 Tax=Glycomyces arizonensis TaxID=256035 RepID=UPI0004117353|nr:hypothetical protein [Glycomyces arizonensis]
MKPHRIREIRRRYARALDDMPLLVQPTALPDPDRITVLGTAAVAGRGLRFGTQADLPRLWVAFADVEPALLGYVAGLVVGEPQLWICDRAHESWALANTSEVKRAAANVWFDCQRVCEG